MASVRSAIGQAVKARIQTISAVNGWGLPVKGVYYDKIPMGLELGPEDLPAIFVLDAGADITHEHHLVQVELAFRLQLVDIDEATDDRINEMIRQIAKAFYADSPTAERTDAFRSLHPKVWQLTMVRDETDLHMIDANRIATMTLIVHYRTSPYDL